MLLARRYSVIDRWVAPLAVASVLLATMFAALVLGLLSGIEPLFALLVGLAVIGVGTMVVNYQAGIWLFIVLYPMSSTVLMPRQLFGVSGANPVNLLFIVCIASIGFVAVGDWARGRVGRLPNYPRYWWWWYVLPITFAAALGIVHVSEIPAQLTLGSDPPVVFSTPAAYLRDIYLRPMITLFLAALVQYAVVRSKRPLSYLIPVVLGGLSYVLLTFFIIGSTGLSLSALASPAARAYLSAIGLHANEVSLLLNSLTAICFFTALGARGALRWTLFACAALAAAGVVLTFSRGGFLGFGLMYAMYLAHSRNWRSLLVALGVGSLGVLLAPDAVWDRLLTGVKDQDVSAISAGRVTDIWLPLLPEILRSPLFGTGLSAVLWSEPVKLGTLPALQPHNAYLASLLDMGLVGTAAVITFGVLLYKHLRQIAAAMSDPLYAAFAYGTSCLLPIYAVQAFTDHRLTPTAQSVLMWCCVGIVLGLERRAQASAGAP